MLQAIIRNKARSFFRQHGRQEDIVTSCVFDALRYMPPEQAGTFLSWIMPERPELQGARVEDVCFWPRNTREDPGDQQREPDVIVEMRGTDGCPLNLLIEVKWRGGQLGGGQARDQWRLFGPASQGRGRSARVLHVFVVDDAAAIREKLASEADQFEQDEPISALGWRDAQTVLRWFDVAARLQRRSGETGCREARRLAEDVASLLRELGQRPFAGFQHLPQQPVSAPPFPVFFGSGPRHRFTWPALRVEAPEQPGPVFFSSTRG